jgi:hypothetical protein
MSFASLLKWNQKTGLFGDDHAEDFEKFRLIRNSYAHFPEPLHELSSLKHTMQEEADFETILHNDALAALRVMGRYFDEYPYPGVRVGSKEAKVKKSADV